MPSGNSRVRAWLQLIRLPNCFTAIPDALAGAMILSYAFHGEASGIGAANVALAGACGFVAYLAGVTMNDVLDLTRDKAARPERPLPSGRVSRAVGWATVLFGFGILFGLAATVGTQSIVVAAILLAFITAYNTLKKPVPVLGLPLMGGSRAMNVLLGMAIAADVAGVSLLDTIGVAPVPVLMLPIVLWLYVLSISIVAKFEGTRPWAVRLVPRMILGIAILDAAFVLGLTGDPIAALVVAVWFIPAAGLARAIAMS